MGSESTDSTTVGGVTPNKLGVRFEQVPAGASLGRYLVLGEVGRGAMGRVLRAYDPKLQREVAIKEVQRSALGSAEAARLVAEARAMAKLSHPNVVAVFDVEHTDGEQDDHLALVMEYVPGTTLKGWLRKADRSWQEIVARFVDAGRGLAAAHAAGILHRDFKPANVLISDEGQVKVTDFGLAKGVHAAATASGSRSGYTSSDGGDSITEVGFVVGTPRYMAPEQHAGCPLSPAADQFGFCVALWEALHGEPPFSGKHLGSLKKKGPPPWSRTDVPKPVTEAIGRGLAPDPDERWPDMDQLLATLAPAPQGRSRGWITAVAGAGAVGVAVAGYASWSKARAELCSGAADKLAGTWDDERREATRSAIAGVGADYAAVVWERTELALDTYADNWALMHVDTCEATTIRGEQSEAVMDLRMACLQRAKVDLAAAVGVLTRADPDVVRNAHQVIAGLRPLWRCADVDALRSDVAPPSPEDVTVVEQARALLSESKAEREGGRYDASLEKTTEAKKLMSDVDYAPMLTEIALEEGFTLDELGKYEEAAAALERSIETGTRARQWKLVAVAQAQLIAVVGYELRRMDEALRLAATARGLADDPPTEATLRNNIAGVLMAKGDYEEAEAEYRQALALREDFQGPEHPSMALAHNNLGAVLYQQGRFEEAEAENRRALALQEAALGPGHPSLAQSYNALANVLQSQGKYEEGAMELRRALELLQETFGPEHPHVAMARSSLGLILQAQGKFAESEAQHRRAAALLEASLGPEHAGVATPYNNLANVLYAQGKHAEAEAAQRRALTVWEAALDANHPDVALSHNNLGVILIAQGRHEQAEAENRRALAIREQALAPDHPDIAQSRYNLGRILMMRDQPAEALPLLEAAWTRFDDETLPAHNRGAAAFLLAQALWETARDAESRRRAHALAERAGEDYLEAGEVHAGKGEDVEAWLTSHPAPRQHRP